MQHKESNKKIKSLSLASNPVRCKLANNNCITDQVSKIEYLGAKIMSKVVQQNEVMQGPLNPLG